MTVPGKIICLLLILSSGLFGQTFSDPGFSSKQVVAGLTAPIGFKFAPDGRIFIWEKAGRVRIFKNGILLATPFVDIRDDVNRNTDRGLIGLELDPNFSTNGYVYLAYVFENQGDPVSDQPRTQRVTRVQADPANPDVALPNETVILGKVTDPNCDLTLDCSPNNHDTHTIDHLEFGPDSKLYVSIGDGAHYGTINGGPDPDRLRAQNLDALNGKILRINADGTGPSDNPFFDGNPNSNRSKVYDYGLRNPYKFTFDSRDQSLFIGDVGSSYFEEINHGRGKNFGWPCYEGPKANPDHITAFDYCKTLTTDEVTFPSFYYPRTDSAATIMLGPVYSGAAYPAEYKGSLFYADFVGKWIHRLPIDANGVVGAEKVFATTLVTSTQDGPVYVSQGPDGKLYYLLIGSGQIRRIDFSGSLNQVPRAVATASPVSGLSPLDVAFSGSGSTDPDGDTLSYLWDFGDGSTSTTANPTHRYQTTGVQKFTARLTVKDPSGASDSATVEIEVGSLPPVATITKPASEIVATVGQTIEYSGSATDPEDGALTGTSLFWQVIIQHNDHFHVMSDNTGAGGSFTVQEHGGVGDTYSYIIRLTATDSVGLTDVKEVRVRIAPQNVTLSLTPANGGSTSASVLGGETANYALQVSGPAGFAGTVTFTCAGAPEGGACTVMPPSIDLAEGVAKPFNVAVTTLSTSNAGLSGHGPFTIPMQLGFAVGVGSFGLLLAGGKRRGRIAGMSLVFMAAIGLAACAGGIKQNPQAPSQRPEHIYLLKVTGTSGGSKGDLDLSLTVR